MTKNSKGRASAKSRVGAKSYSKTRRSKVARAKSATPPESRKSKQDMVVALLSRPGGVTIAAMMGATSWQAHSVRGFLAGVVRKKLGLTLQSEKTDEGRVYGVIDNPDNSEAQAA